MRQSFIIGLVLAVALVWVTGARAEMKEGLWEITTKAEMKGMGGQMPATTMRSCITKKDMVPSPASPDKNQECKMKDMKIAGDTVTYAMQCSGKDGTAIEMTGRMTYKGETSEGTTDMTMKTKDQGTMQMSAKMTGKYIGPCTK